MADNSYTAVKGAAADDEDERPKDCKTAMTDDMTALRTLFCAPINVLLVCVPLGAMSKTMGWSSSVIFFTNFTAIIPLAGLLGGATEALAEHTGQTIGGLVNATFGNAVEIIITIEAIKKGLCQVVKCGLVGSGLSNLLLVLGMSFVASGMVRKEQTFNKDSAGANSSCLLVAAIGVVIPTLFVEGEMEGASQIDCVFMSRMCAVIMAIVYCFFLFFQLKTHTHHFEDVSEAITAEEYEKAGSLVARMSKSFLGTVFEEEEDEEPVLSPSAAALCMIIITLIVAYLSELMVGSIEDVSDACKIPEAFIGLILLPVVGNAAEHMTAVVSAFKGKMDLAIGVAVGSSTQISLLVVPFSVMTGWYFDQPMDLNFGPFYAGIFLLTVFLVGNVLQDGASNWLEGAMLIGVYVMIAVITWSMSEM